MKYISTCSSARKYSFRDSVLLGIPNDGGLFVPETIPKFDASYFEQIT